MPRYDILAIDLDGTLLDSKRRVSDSNIRAIEDARAAGMQVIICTGRGLVESKEALDAIKQAEPVVVAGGSIISDPVTTQTLHRFSLDAALVDRAVSRLLNHRHPVMVLKDPVAAGYDYLIVHGPQRLPLDPVTLWWFEKLKVRVRYADHLAEDEHPEHTVRLGVCGLSGVMSQIHDDIHEAFGEHATMHHFPAVLEPEHEAKLPPGQKLHILEVFDRSASKWSAIRWLADQRGIHTSRICAIGDEINDLPMIREAGLGIAMDNAIPAVRDAAKQRTRSNDDDGVSHAIRNVLAGEW
jgi:hydroxymethylpyrimidine pyrophosphatase-like HAD family hydrolase